jgi:hypothetical protein
MEKNEAKEEEEFSNNLPWQRMRQRRKKSFHIRKSVYGGCVWLSFG